MTFEQRIRSIRPYQHLFDEDVWRRIRKHDSMHVGDYVLQTAHVEHREYENLDKVALLSVHCSVCHAFITAHWTSLYLIARFQESGHG